MKRDFASLLLVLSLMVNGFGQLIAAENIQPPSERINLTVINPEPEPLPAYPMLYPAEVTAFISGNTRQIIKIYELHDEENPDWIPRDSFERDGWSYVLSDITRRDTTTVSSREHTEQIVAESESRDIADILPLLEASLPFHSS